MKIKIVRNLLSLFGIILLSGCASTEQTTGCNSKQVWYQAGISAEQTRRDLAASQYEAMLNEKSTSVSGATLGQTLVLNSIVSSEQINRQNHMIQASMTAKGYSLVNTNSPLLKDVQPPKPTPQQVAAVRKAFVDTKAKAESGDAEAQYELGCCYSLGKGVDKDSVETVKWIRKAAEQNLAKGQGYLGYCYMYGKGVEKDFVEAAKWLRKAAEQEEPIAQYYLGSCYANGYGVLKDYVEGYKWLLLASAKGSAKYQNDISNLENRMTREQIAEGQKLARDFKPTNKTTP